MDTLEATRLKRLPFGSGRFDALDTLRGIAATAVALGHLGLFFDRAYYLAVDFFLVLSGFVLAHSYYFRPRITLAQFAYFRWARMYPLHLLTLLAVVLIGYPGTSDVDTRELVLHFLFIQNMGFGPDPLVLNVPSWTISVEFWINIGIFAVLAMCGYGLTGRNCIVIAIIGAVSFAILARYTGHLWTNTYDFKGVLNAGLVRCTASFCVGILTYRIFTLSRKRRSSASLDALLIVAFAACLVAPIKATPWDFIAPPLFALTIWVFSTSESVVAAIMRRFRVRWRYFLRNLPGS